MQDGAKLSPIEIKSGATVTPDFFIALDQWQAQAGPIAGAGAVVYGGDAGQARGDWPVLAWRDLAARALPVPGLSKPPGSKR